MQCGKIHKAPPVATTLFYYLQSKVETEGHA